MYEMSGFGEKNCNFQTGISSKSEYRKPLVPLITVNK